MAKTEETKKTEEVKNTNLTDTKTGNSFTPSPQKGGKVKIVSDDGKTHYVKSDGVVHSEIFAGRENGKFYINIEYSQTIKCVVGPFNSHGNAENIIINDL